MVSQFGIPSKQQLRGAVTGERGLKPKQIGMFRIRHINVTAKDNTPINSLPYPLPLALANGSKMNETIEIK